MDWAFAASGVYYRLSHGFIWPGHLLALSPMLNLHYGDGERERETGRQAGRQRAWVTWSKHALFMCVICLYFPISSHKRAWSIPQAFLAVASLGGAAGSVPILVYVRSLIRNWPWLGLKKKHQHQNGGFHKWDIPKTDGLWKILLKWMIWRYREVLPFQKTSLNRNCRA